MITQPEQPTTRSRANRLIARTKQLINIQN